MRPINEWQKALREAAEYKFPNSDWDISDRIASVHRQVDDVKVALTVEKGKAKSGHLAHKDMNHSIGALVADAFILAEKRGVDTEAELEKVLAWFKERTQKS
jgi:nitric oxide synthase oxygenase domain/subunit